MSKVNPQTYSMIKKTLWQKTVAINTSYWINLLKVTLNKSLAKIIAEQCWKWTFKILSSRIESRNFHKFNNIQAYLIIHLKIEISIKKNHFKIIVSKRPQMKIWNRAHLNKYLSKSDQLIWNFTQIAF